MPPKPMEPNGRFGYISSMFVVPEHRGHGLAGRLMAALIDKAENLGINLLSLQASEAGRPIYEKIGFSTWAEMGTNVPTMLKRLPNP